MRVDLYTRSVLTIIAGCLLVLAFGRLSAPRYQVVATESVVMKINTTTGQAWWTSGSPPVNWEPAVTSAAR